MSKLKTSRASGDVVGSDLTYLYAREIAARHVPTRFDARLLGGVAPALALSATLVSGVAQAADITVTAGAVDDTTNTNCSLVEAIKSADGIPGIDACTAGDAGADTIILPSNSTFELTGSFPEAGGNGLEITTAVTIEGNGSIITRNSATEFRILRVTSSGNVTLNNLTLSNGTQTLGGGIYNSGSATITNSTLSGNSAAAGGGIFNSGTLSISNSTLSGNSVGNSGGGVFNDGSATLTNSTLSGNSAYNAGGIWNENSATITNSTLSGNSAYNAGGGILNFLLGTLSVSNSTLSGNSTSRRGGGLWTYSDAATITNSTLSANSAGICGGGIYSRSGGGGLSLTNSTLSGNSAGSGGGIYARPSATLSLTNSTLSGNSASSSGGGIASHFGSLVTLTNSTLTGNSAGSNGGGVFSDFGSLTLSHSIIANQLSGTDCTFFEASSTTLGHNLDSDDSCQLVGPLDLGTDLPDTDPLLAPLASNGGPTQTHALLTGSPAIDAGDNSVCSAAPVNNLDQRGVARPIGTNCDIGAFETGASFDFGDAPDADPQVAPGTSYPTLLVNNGAAHVTGVAGAPFLGTVAPDAEADGNPNATASGDDTALPDDEGGLSPLVFTVGTPGTGTVTVTNGGVSVGNAWVDFNRDGDFDDAGEQVATDAATASGTYTFAVNLPVSTPTGTYFVRLRVCTTSTTCNTPRGIAANGEVEDFAITVNPAGGGGGGGGGGSGVVVPPGDGGGGGGALDFWTLLLLGFPGLRMLRRRMRGD